MDAAGRLIPREGGWPIFFWRPHAGHDSVVISMGHGWGGMELFLAVRARGDTLRGRAVRHRDYGPPFQLDGGSASIIRIPCVG